MTHSYFAYIDESGDDGLANFREPGKQGGASKWLVIAACVVRSTRSLESVSWRDDITSKCQLKSRDLHFAKLSHPQRRVACQILSQKQLRFSAVIGKKDTPDALVFTQKNQLYWYLTRYLIERVSWLCRDFRGRVREGDGRVKITFSRRGNMEYGDFRSYLNTLRQKGNETSIHRPVIDIDGVDAMDHSRLASLQLADCGARAVASAIEPDPYGNIESEYLQILRERIYNRNGNYKSYGLKFLPHFEQAHLSASQAAAFRGFR